jgi:AcrR family transcriptional regulator
MGRMAKFSEEMLVRATISEIANNRPSGIQDIAAACDAPIGSVYHRFPSHHALRATAWIAIVRDFQSEFLRDLTAAKTVGEGAEAALAVVRWSRSNLDAAKILIRHRQQDFISANTPEPQRSSAENLNKEMAKAIRAFARRVDRSGLRCSYALVGSPYGAVRLSLPEPPPAALDNLVRAAYFAIME